MTAHRAADFLHHLPGHTEETAKVLPTMSSASELEEPSSSGLAYNALCLLATAF